MSFKNAKVLKTEPLQNSQAVWTRLHKSTYLDPKGIQRTWEWGDRPTRPKNSTIDGVGIIGILEKSTGPEIILQKQYRPPLDKVVIEIPAGLSDEGESAEDTGIREMKEETGYVGVAVEEDTSTVMYNDPGFCNTNLRLVHLSIDLSHPANQDPKPELEENEFIEVFSVKLSGLWEECRRLEKEGYAIDARVGTLAEGIRMAKRWGL
ncbi:NUDIX hydrolase domain-like protein [Xylogone sp. PMI_703]|nr:NUDIX hydrolase domain-like protein [Xylogone sp. PMI_703]